MNRKQSERKQYNETKKRISALIGADVVCKVSDIAKGSILHREALVHVRENGYYTYTSVDRVTGAHTKIFVEA
jgi:hypothetical protein